MAELFLARDTRTGRFAVLKRILPYLAEDSEFLAMFLDEARIVSRLHHPSVVEMSELGQVAGATYIAMEWVDGIDLRRLLSREQERGGVIPPGIAAWVVARLCEGLAYAHGRADDDGKPLGIIHRDVSPQNVMLSYRGEVKLVDFGIAKASAWVSRSKPGVIKGKFLYLAPEQLLDDPLDHRVDLFAVGTLLYELTTGQSPFLRQSTEAVIYAVRMEDADPPSSLRVGYPPGLARIIARCHQKDRELRYQRADEIRAALEDFLRVEAPTTRTDVLRYLGGLYGNDDERTRLHVPDNARVTLDTGGPQPSATASMPAPVPSRPVVTDADSTAESPPPAMEELEGLEVSTKTAPRPVGSRPPPLPPGRPKPAPPVPTRDDLPAADVVAMRAAPSGKGSTRGVVPVPVRRPAIDRSAAFDPDDFEPTRALPSQPEPELLEPFSHPARRALASTPRGGRGRGRAGPGGGGSAAVGGAFPQPGPGDGRRTRGDRHPGGRAGSEADHRRARRPGAGDPDGVGSRAAPDVAVPGGEGRRAGQAAGPRGAAPARFRRPGQRRAALPLRRRRPGWGA